MFLTRGGMMFFWFFFSFFLVEESFKWFLLLNLFHGIIIDYIDNFGLACILFCVLQNWYQSKYKSQKEKNLNEIVWWSQFDGLSAGSYDTDSITDSEECGCDNPEKSEIEKWIIFLESKISYYKVFEFKTDIPTKKYKYTHKDDKKAFEKMSIKQPYRMRYVIYRSYLYEWQHHQKKRKRPKIKDKDLLMLSESSKFLNESWNSFREIEFFLHLRKEKVKDWY